MLESIDNIYRYLLADENKLTATRARKIQRFLSQPLHVAEVFTGSPGNFVTLKDTIRGFMAIIAGEHDNLPEHAFYMVGGGALEVRPHKITVLADTAARAKDLDEAAALAAKQSAEEALRDRVGAMEIAEAQAELARAAAQLRAIEKLRQLRKGG